MLGRPANSWCRTKSADPGDVDEPRQSGNCGHANRGPPFTIPAGSIRAVDAFYNSVSTNGSVTVSLSDIYGSLSATTISMSGGLSASAFNVTLAVSTQTFSPQVIYVNGFDLPTSTSSGDPRQYRERPRICNWFCRVKRRCRDRRSENQDRRRRRPPALGLCRDRQHGRLALQQNRAGEPTDGQSLDERRLRHGEPEQCRPGRHRPTRTFQRHLPGGQHRARMAGLCLDDSRGAGDCQRQL